MIRFRLTIRRLRLMNKGRLLMKRSFRFVFAFLKMINHFISMILHFFLLPLLLVALEHINSDVGVRFEEHINMLSFAFVLS